MTVNLVPLIQKAQKGDTEALLELFFSVEPSIINHSTRYSKQMNKDCYQELATQFIIAVHSFDLEKYLNI